MLEQWIHGEFTELQGNTDAEVHTLAAVVTTLLHGRTFTSIESLLDFLLGLNYHLRPKGENGDQTYLVSTATDLRPIGHLVVKRPNIH